MLPGTCGFAVRVPLHAGQQEEEARIGAEHTARGVGGVFFAAQGFVIAAKALRFGELGLLHLIRARERIEIRGEPAVVFGEQAEDELAGIVGADADEIFPAGFGAARRRERRRGRSESECGCRRNRGRRRAGKAF